MTYQSEGARANERMLLGIGDNKPEAERIPRSGSSSILLLLAQAGMCRLSRKHPLGTMFGRPFLQLR
jgi:hypothetical protein